MRGVGGGVGGWKGHATRMIALEKVKVIEGGKETARCQER